MEESSNGKIEEIQKVEPEELLKQQPVKKLSQSCFCFQKQLDICQVTLISLILHQLVNLQIFLRGERVGYKLFVYSITIFCSSSLMEESSNGKIEEIQKVEPEEKDNKLVIDYVEEPKVDIESVREVLIDENSGSVKESHYGIDPSSETSNGKIESSQKVEPEEKDNKVVIDYVGEPEAELGSIVIDENSESLKESRDGIDPNSDTWNTPEEGGGSKEESSLVKDLGVSEKEEKEVINSIVDSDEPIVPLLPEVSSTVEASIEKSVDSDVTEVESKGIGQTNGVGPVLADGLLDEKKEIISPPSTSDEPDEVVSEVVSSTTEEIKLPSSDDKDGLSASAADNMSKGIEETVLPSLDENLALPDVVKKGIEDTKVADPDKTGDSSGIVVKEFVENVNDSLKPSTNATIVGSNDAFPESTGNPHVISISQQTMQPTSWRSCCGLFEVLRRSNR